MTTYTINLVIGYKDATGQVHRRVTFGKRLTGRDLLLIDSDPQSQLPTQYNDLIIRAAITEFGTLPCPVPLRVLLELDSIDRDDLLRAFNFFQAQGQAQFQAELISDNTVRLAYGIRRGEHVYRTLEFGKRVTGLDEIEADKMTLRGLARAGFLAGRQIVRLIEDGGASDTGPVTLDDINTMDASDVSLLLLGAERWRQSFRRIGQGVQAELGGNSLSTGSSDGVDGDRNTIAADREIERLH